jgi:hypothetical protein
MIVALYKVVGQRRVLIIVEAQSHEEIDRTLMAALPLAPYEELEEILPLRAYERFADDVKLRWQYSTWRLCDVDSQTWMKLTFVSYRSASVICC